MNKILFYSSFLILLLASPSHASLTGINIISEGHRIGGSIYPDDFDHYGDSYSIQSTSPVEQALQWDSSLGAKSSAGEFCVSAFGAFEVSGNAFAESTYYFQSSYNKLVLNLSASWAGVLTPDVNFEIINVNTNTQLASNTYDEDYALNNDPSWSWGEQLNAFESYQLSVNTSDIYMLRLYADATDSDYDSSLQCEFLSKPIPEPTSFFLFSSGFATLLAFRRRGRKLGK